jgi:polyisoprenoid-binding protein YceI
MKKVLFLISIFCAFSQSYTIENGMFHLEARASVIGIDDEFDASGKGLTGEVDFNKKSFKFVYDLWEIDTGIELRNDHMHENHLETEEYPEAIFEGIISSFSDSSIVAEGTFSLHGETKPLNLTAKRSGSKVTVEWKLNLKDYNIEVPRKFFFAKLNEVLSMDASFDLKEK